MKQFTKKIKILCMALLLSIGLAACSNPAQTATPKTFPAFTATDLQGHALSNEVFKENKVTVINLWFTGCEGCVKEMPKLEQLSKQLDAKGGRMLGICVDATDKESKKQAVTILKKNGATYTNLAVAKKSKAQSYLDSVTAFPTTLLVDRHGHIVGKPIVGSIDSKKQMRQLMKRVDAIVKKDEVKQ